VARALIVGCGCRGLELGARLREGGWEVRGTTRDPARLAAIEAVGIEAAIADPDRPGTILATVADVTVVFWLLGSAVGEDEAVAAVHGSRLERLLERLVESPVRGFVYEGAGVVDARHLLAGAAIVRAAGERWRIPVEIVDAEVTGRGRWLDAMDHAAARLLRAGY
jgi:uncharacterized protein YbjT (DUF2867 family)